MGQHDMVPTRTLQQNCRPALALAQAGAAVPRRSVSLAGGTALGGELPAQLLCPLRLTGDVVAHVGDQRRRRRRCKQRVEGGHTVGLSRRHAETLAKVAERAGSDVADSVLNGPQPR